MRVMCSLNARIPLAKLASWAAYIGSRRLSQTMVTSAEHIVVPVARRNLRANKSIFEGNLFRSLAARVAGGMKMNFIQIGSFGVEYGLNIEKGTPAGMTMTDDAKLVRWARIKLGTSYPKAAASAIKRRIETVGSPPKPFLMPAWDETKKAFVDDLTTRVRSALK